MTTNYETKLILNKKYKVFLTNSFKYEGVLLCEAETFIQILDSQNNKSIIIYKNSISSIMGAY